MSRNGNWEAIVVVVRVVVAREIVVTSMEAESLRVQEILARKMLFYMPNPNPSTNIDYFCLTDLIGADGISETFTQLNKNYI